MHIGAHICITKLVKKFYFRISIIVMNLGAGRLVDFREICLIVDTADMQTENEYLTFQ